jgi:hypothetical protein
VHPGWEVYDVNWWYAAPVSGLGFNDNAIDITYAPGAKEGEPATLAFTPDFGDVALENRTRTVAAGAEETIDFFRSPAPCALARAPCSSAGARTEHLALPTNLYAAARASALAARRRATASRAHH